MRSYKSIILSLLLLLVSLGSRAAVNHFITLTGQVGEHSWITGTDAVKANSSFGIGGGVGVHYELQKKHFLLTAGLDANPSYSVFSLVPYQTSFECLDTQQDRMTYTYYFHDRKDAYTNVALHVPLMLGGQFDKVYFLVGAKVSMSLFGQANGFSLVNSEGSYQQFIGDFKDMYEHAFFTDHQVATQMPIAFNMNVLASLELGLRLGDGYKATGFGYKQKQKIQYRVALFADYGVLNAVNTAPYPLYSTPTLFNESDMTSGVVINNLLLSEARPNRVNPLQIGVKFTVLFKVGEPKKCVICHEDDR